MKEKYDVIVVGAGPAGLTAAKTAAAEGAKTLVLEMRANIAGQSSFEALVPPDFIKYKGAVVGNVKEAAVNSVHEKLIIKGKIGKILDRTVFSRSLAEEAVSSGAEIWISAPVRHLVTKGGAIKGVKAESGGWSELVEGEVIIDASGGGGQWSGLFLRKVLGNDWKPGEVAFSSEYLMANAESDKAEMFFTSYLAPRGRAWIYPFEDRMAVAGIYGVRIHPDTALDEFIGKVSPKSLEKASPVSATRSQVSLQGPLEKTFGEGIIAVGGAAGQICPLSGRGLRYALDCGDIAGRTAVDAITEGDVSKTGLSKYEDKWKSIFGREFEACKAVQSSLAVAQDRKMDELLRVLKGSPHLQRHFLGIFTGSRIRSSLKGLMKSEEVVKILGNEVKDKVLKPA